MKRVIAAVSIFFAVTAMPVGAQDKPGSRRGFVWDDRPSIVFGKNVSVDLKGRFLAEGRWFDPETDADTWAVRTARVGLKGKLTKHFEWEVEREIDGTFEQLELGKWKDVYAQWQTFDAFSIRAGRFKMPFGLEENTGISEIDFAYRTLGSAALTPARDTGVMAYGELGRVRYEAGVFDDDGDNADSNEPQFVEAGREIENVGPSIAGRVTGDLFRLLPVPRRLKSANVGIAYTNASIPEGLNSLRGESFLGVDDFFDRVYVNGRRQRLGTQFEWTPGPTGIKAEWIRTIEDRKKQSNRNEDLSDFLGTAWYVSGTWFVTGEDKDNNINAKHPFLRGGIGAVELAVRYEELSFGSASKEGLAFSNPRSDHLVTNKDQVWTFGLNWTTSKWTRVVLNAIHESIEDESRAFEGDNTTLWSGLLRLNIVF